MSRLILLFTGLIMSTNLLAFTATVDRTKIQYGDSLTLILSETDSSIKGEPNIELLKKDFRILGSSTSSQHRYINGKKSFEKTWKITLLPNKIGKFIIPALKLGSQSSQAIELTVSKSVQNNNQKTIFIEAGIDNGNHYQNAQMIYKIKIFSPISTRIQDLSLEPLKIPGSIVKQLNNDKHYQSNRNGITYSVIERDYTVFPNKAGSLTIKGPILSGLKENSKQSSPQNGFNRFFDDPFFNSSFSTNMEQFTRVANDITVNVKSVPVTYPKDKAWLPAKNLILNDKISENPNSTKAGDAITHTITVQALGLNASQLPTIHYQLDNGIKSYPSPAVLKDENTVDAVLGTSEQATAYIKTSAGKFTIPEKTITWWNTETEKVEVSKLAGHEFDIQVNTENTTNTTPENLDKPLIDNRNTTLEQQSLLSTLTIQNIIPWLLFIAAVCIWLITLIYYKRKNKSSRNHLKEKIVINKANHSDTQQLQKACENNDAKAAALAIINWQNYKFPNQAVQNIDDWIKILGKQELSYELKILQDSLYSKSDKQWVGNKLWEEFQGYQKTVQKPAKAKNKKMLPALFSITGD